MHVRSFATSCTSYPVAASGNSVACSQRLVRLFSAFVSVLCCLQSATHQRVSCGDVAVMCYTSPSSLNDSFISISGFGVSSLSLALVTQCRASLLPLLVNIVFVRRYLAQHNIHVIVSHPLVTHLCECNCIRNAYNDVHRGWQRTRSETARWWG